MCVCVVSIQTLIFHENKDQEVTCFSCFLSKDKYQGKLSVSFQPWPEDALERVANRFLEDADIEEHDKVETVHICKYFHQSVRDLSDRCWFSCASFLSCFLPCLLPVVARCQSQAKLQTDPLPLILLAYLSCWYYYSFSLSLSLSLSLPTTGHGMVADGSIG